MARFSGFKCYDWVHHAEASLVRACHCGHPCNCYHSDATRPRPGRRNRPSSRGVRHIATAGGGLRWYEFRLNKQRDAYLYQQGTYAPDALYRWMGSIAMDRQGNIGIGYSFGGTPHFPGQRFAARLAGDPLGTLTFAETILVEGEASQTTGNRWEDYSTTAIDPSDDCTFWYVGDYLKKDAASYSTRIGAFRLPGCRGSSTPRLAKWMWWRSRSKGKGESVKK